ncbi:MAG: hypothetical protein JWN85_2605 [Gammaproteobacteria bacterium]|nr:hypothetical protein [Gammaproteobacteria bacterium]
MNRAIIVTCFVGLAAMTGCATRAPLVLRNPVGPERPHAPRRRTDGDLVVYSATHATTYAQSEYPVHTDYTILTRDDKFIEQIANETGPFNANPATVRLPPGEYHVKALTERGGFVTVPVVIEAGKTTVVDLNGEALPQGADANEAADAADWVRMPDGHVVGWRSDQK